MSFSGSYTTPTDKPEPEPAEAPDAKRGPDSGSAHATQLRADEDPGQLKRLSAETWWNYSPVNSTEFGVQNILKFQIPTTDVIFDMSRAFITLDVAIPVGAYRIVERAQDRNSDGFATYAEVDYRALDAAAVRDFENDYIDERLTADDDFPVILNAATVFNIAEMNMDGNVLYHNDYVQTQARLWQLNKNDEWLDGQPQTFFRPSANTNQKYENNQLSFYNIKLESAKRVTGNAGQTTACGINSDKLKAYYTVRRQLKIPLVMLFPQFEVMNGWPSFLVKQILFLQLTVSNVKKYLCAAFQDGLLESGPYNVVDVANRAKMLLNYGDNEYIDPQTISGNPVFRYTTGDDFLSDSRIDLEFDIMNLMIDHATLYLPSHIPEFKEREEYTALVNSGLTYGFKSYHILSNGVDLAQSANSITKSLTYNSAVNNLEAINLLFLRDGTEVVFDKPGIEAIQCNLGNSWQLAPSGTHVEPLYTRDSDLLADLLKGWGQAEKSYMQTVSEDVLSSYRFGRRSLALQTNSGGRPRKGQGDDDETTCTNNYGAYTLYFDASPGDELGVAAGQYARLIALRFNIDRSLPENDRANYSSGKLYVCQQTFSTITIAPNSVFIANPFAEEYDAAKDGVITEYRNLNYSETGLRTHGFTVTHGLGGDLLGKGLEYVKEKGMPIIKQKADELFEKAKQPGFFRGIFRKVREKFRSWFGRKKHGYLPLKAIKLLGPAGYRRFHHRIQKWDHVPMSHGMRRKFLYHLARKWDHDPANPMRGHGAYKAHFQNRPNRFPGLRQRRFEDESLERIRPNIYRGDARRPPRLQPFARFFAAIPSSHGDLCVKHGLTTPYHGWLKRAFHKAKEWIKSKIPEKVRKVFHIVAPHLKKVAGSLAEQWLEKHPSWKAKVAAGKAVWNAAKQMYEDIDKRTEDLERRLKGETPESRTHGKMARRYMKSLPHAKRTVRFYKKYYARQHGKGLLKLEKSFWNAGAKRMADGLY